MSKAASVSKNIKGQVTFEGVSTSYEGGREKESKVVVKVGQGLFARRFILPMDVLASQNLLNILIDGKELVDTHYLSLNLSSVTKVPGQFLTYEATVNEVITPLSVKTLTALVDSKSLTKEPASPAQVKQSAK